MALKPQLIRSANLTSSRLEVALLQFSLLCQQSPTYSQNGVRRFLERRSCQEHESEALYKWLSVRYVWLRFACMAALSFQDNDPPPALHDSPPALQGWPSSSPLRLAPNVPQNRNHLPDEYHGAADIWSRNSIVGHLESRVHTTTLRLVGQSSPRQRARNRWWFCRRYWERFLGKNDFQVRFKPEIK